MKVFKKFLIVFSMAFVFGIGSANTMIAFAGDTAFVEPMTRADILEWRYKTENKKVYRRQYNCTKRVWVGEWQYVADVV